MILLVFLVLDRFQRSVLCLAGVAWRRHRTGLGIGRSGEKGGDWEEREGIRAIRPLSVHFCCHFRLQIS